MLKRLRLSPTCLELEITETSLMTQMHETIQAFWKLRDHGVTVAVDDFGTGYSSLSYLRRLPVDTLKIDRSFIDEIESDVNDQEITRAIIAMAHSLGLDVVAEGVERNTQLDALKAMQCPQYQGFGLSRPLAVADMTAWLAESGRKWAAVERKGAASWVA
jgi:EAL domain-containing protein (putative c-di-GMP-specific phosphodiesterase class I)